MFDAMLERLRDILDNTEDISDALYDELAELIKWCCYNISVRDGADYEEVCNRITGVEL